MTFNPCAYFSLNNTLLNIKENQNLELCYTEILSSPLNPIKEACFANSLSSLSFPLLPSSFKCSLSSQLDFKQFSRCGLGITGQVGWGNTNLNKITAFSQS